MLKTFIFSVEVRGMFTFKKKTFIHQGRIKLIKLLRTIIFQINAVLMNFLIIKES